MGGSHEAFNFGVALDASCFDRAYPVHLAQLDPPTSFRRARGNQKPRWRANMKSTFRGVLVAFLLVMAHVLYAQDLQVKAFVTGEDWIARDATVTLRLNRPLQPADGKLAIFIGPMDITDLFVSRESLLTYTPTTVLLPSGESELSLSLVSQENEWHEIARFPLKVRTRTGLDKANIDPRVSLNNNGQVAEGHSPDGNQPPRETYQDFAGQANVTSEHVRDHLALRTQWDLVGASEQDQALRFAEKGEDAARIDLSSYLVQMQMGLTEVSIGHIGHGRQRHLIDSYSSRGMMIKTGIGSVLDFSATAMNGTEIVGWNNFVGLSNRRHRFYSGTVGVEFLKNRPGGLRLESSAVDASMLPLNNFNQGVINDAEESQGFGFRLQGSDNSQRFRFEGGFARSKFTNPEDPFLSQGDQLVPVDASTRNARYATLALGLLQNVSLSPTWQANFNVNIRHERVDPLYRSLGAFARADYRENAVDLQGNIGSIALLYSHARSEDNLDEIPSILKTKTRNNSLNLNIPLGSVFSSQTGPSAWLPSWSYSYNRTHQFGDSLPINSGFADSHVPDQVSNSHNSSLEWQANRWRFGYQLAISLQDNRQVGRETADFKNTNNSLNLGLTPVNVLDLSLDLAFENAENKEVDRTDLTRSLGVTFNLRTTNTSALNASISTTNTEDDGKTSERNNTFINAQWSLSFTLDRSANQQFLQGQAFIRFTRNEEDSRDTVFGFADESSSWTVNTGVNLSLF